MAYDKSQEVVDKDSQGRLIRVTYKDDLIFEKHYHCFNCTWTGQIDEFGPNLDHCIKCGEGQHAGGLQTIEVEDGPALGAREEAYRE